MLSRLISLTKDPSCFFIYSFNRNFLNTYYGLDPEDFLLFSKSFIIWHLNKWHSYDLFWTNLYKMWHLNQGSFFFLPMKSSYSSIVCWKGYSSCMKLGLHLSQKICWAYLYGFISGSSVLFYWSMCLSLCQYHTLLIIVAIYQADFSHFIFLCKDCVSYSGSFPFTYKF